MHKTLTVRSQQNLTKLCIFIQHLKQSVMLENSRAFASFSVDDVEKAKTFYSQILGLEVTQDNDMGGILTIHIDGGIPVLVYPKPDHTPATFTILNFLVANIDEAVAELKSSGVIFNSYHTEDLKTDENNISRGNGGPNIAWFTDPSGNILSVLETR
jgi:predicted enzyme related to lactoylglutathione lyase